METLNILSLLNKMYANKFVVLFLGYIERSTFCHYQSLSLSKMSGSTNSRAERCENVLYLLLIFC